MKKKALSVVLSLAIAGTLLAGCGGSGSSSQPASNAGAAQTGDAAATDGGSMDIRIISKSFNNQFYQAAFKGANDAAADLGVTVTTNGPDVETNTSQQVEQVKAAVNAKPNAIVLAACDTDSLEETLTAAKEAGIPVIGFDSAFPATLQALSSQLRQQITPRRRNVAQNWTRIPPSRSDPQGHRGEPHCSRYPRTDANSGSIVLVSTAYRRGSQDSEVSTDLQAQSCLVRRSGHSLAACKGQDRRHCSPSSSATDIQSASNTIFSTDNLVGVFAANQDAVNGVISATNDGTDLDKANGKYKDIFVVGFDSGTSQRQAVTNGQFLGSVTQDPYQMGYQAVTLAVKAANGEAVEDVDTGSKWYNAENIDSEEISVLLYD